MAEYIEREKLMQKFADHVKRSNNSDFAPVPTWNQAVQIVEDSPAADVVEQKHGEWKAASEDLIICTSCKCGFLLPYPNRIEEAKTVYGWNFCPNCGAQMDGDSDV